MTSVALVVGVNDYADPSVPALAQCIADAEAFATLLEQPEYGFTVELLLDEGATQRKIRLRSYQLRSTAPQTFLLFFAGHGALVGDRGYLVASDGTEGDYGIEISNLAELIELKGGRSLAILDCCHSGAGLPWRGRVPAHSRELFRNGRVLPGQALLAASRHDQVAAESNTLGHGMLTHFLLDALLGGAADQYGEVTLSAAYDYVCRGFADDPVQRPVLKMQIEDRFVLGRGFLPTAPIVNRQRDVDEAVRSAQARIETLHQSMGVEADAWRNGGWIRASTQLKDLISWRTSKVKALPELVRTTDFNETMASIDGYQARLAALQPGTLVRDGTVRRILGSGAFGAVYLVEGADGEQAYKIYNSERT